MIPKPVKWNALMSLIPGNGDREYYLELARVLRSQMGRAVGEKTARTDWDNVGKAKRGRRKGSVFRRSVLVGYFDSWQRRPENAGKLPQQIAHALAEWLYHKRKDADGRRIFGSTVGGIEKSIMRALKWRSDFDAGLESRKLLADQGEN